MAAEQQLESIDIVAIKQKYKEDAMVH
ncbi:MAG: hypothetical protein K0Q74_1306, partial [Gammaproteobacteria bacterium]|nr:hypothetical protein [Gammaproteobacteria bacterium]